MNESKILEELRKKDNRHIKIVIGNGFDLQSM